MRAQGVQSALEAHHGQKIKPGNLNQGQPPIKRVIKDLMQKRGQLEAHTNFVQEQNDPSLMIDPNMKNFCSQITETVGKPNDLAFIEN